MIKVQIEDIINELELISDEGNSFFKKTTGRLFHISNEEFEYAKSGIKPEKSLPDWQNENIQIAREIIETENYIQLPTEDEIDEYSMMLKFCLLFSDELIHEEIQISIECGEEAIWKLKDIISKNNIGEAWFKFKRAVFRRVAIDWCRRNKIEFV